MIRSAVVVVLTACGGVHDASVVCQQEHPLRADQCGPAADYTPVNSYQGDLSIVNEREDAVVMINGTCTGTLIAATAGPVVITAGHCVRLGDRPLSVFNFEEAPDGDPLRTEGTVIEQSDAPDYALIALDTLPAVTPTPLAVSASDELAIIQHPRGMPKVVAEGQVLDACNGLLYYVDLDTLVGSSGAGVLNRGGYLVGVHTDGDCAKGGTNWGWTAVSIVEASPYLDADSDIKTD
ncbi:MAG: serine protease [Kofleriaceae bacterium]